MRHPGIIASAQLSAGSGGGGGAFAPDGVNFDGATFIGIPSLACIDNRLFACSFWTQQTWIPDASAFIFVSGTPTGINQIAGLNGAGRFFTWELTNFNVGQSNWIADTVCHHVAISVDGTIDGVGNAIVRVYINRQLAIESQVTYGQDFLMNGLNFWVGNNGDTLPSTQILVGKLWEFWCAPGQYIDFSNPTNLNKFITIDGDPVDLGANGETPTGTAPAVYHGGGASSFATNRGTGGAASVTGALTTMAFPPSVDVDFTFPVFTALSPVNGATNVAVNANLTITFDQPVQLGVGYIAVFDTDAYSAFFNVSVDVGTGPGQVSISGSTVTMHLSENMPNAATMSVQVPGGCIQNMAGYGFGQLVLSGWQFTTVA